MTGGLLKTTEHVFHIKWMPVVILVCWYDLQDWDIRWAVRLLGTLKL